MVRASAACLCSSLGGLILGFSRPPTISEAVIPRRLSERSQGDRSGFRLSVRWIVAGVIQQRACRNYSLKQVAGQFNGPHQYCRCCPPPPTGRRWPTSGEQNIMGFSGSAQQECRPSSEPIQSRSGPVLSFYRLSGGRIENLSVIHKKKRRKAAGILLYCSPAANSPCVFPT